MTKEEAQITLANLKRYMSGGGVVDGKANEAIDMAIKALEDPEIIRCKDCGHWRINYYQDVETCFEHRNIDGTEQATRPEDYCSWAERRKE